MTVSEGPCDSLYLTKFMFSRYWAALYIMCNYYVTTKREQGATMSICQDKITKINYSTASVTPITISILKKLLCEFCNQQTRSHALSLCVVLPELTGFSVRLL